MGLILRTTFTEYRAERHWIAAHFIQEELEAKKDKWQGDDELYSELISASTGAFEGNPDNVKYGFTLSQHRWQAIARNYDPQTENGDLPPQAISFVERIADELIAVQKLCPTYGPPYALEGQLRLFLLDDNRGEALINKGYKLASYDPHTCYTAGQVSAMKGDVDNAIQRLNRAVALNQGYYQNVIEIYVLDLERVDLALALAQGNASRLSQLANLCNEDERFAKEASEIQAKAIQVLREKVAAQRANANELVQLANIERKQQENEKAILLYRKALGKNYGHIVWRMQLAKLLAKVGRAKEAEKEARICLRLRPGLPEARKFLETLDVP